jgi:ferric iron reductase protein FhuF
VLPAELTPFTSASTLVTTGEDQNALWTRRRESCCFHYALRNGQGECETCPRIRCR